MRGRQAPAWLFNAKGETKLFQTQSELEDAWENGWTGTKNPDQSLISAMKFRNKQEFIDAVDDDPRYKIQLSMQNTWEELRDAIIEYENQEILSELISK